MSETPQIQNHAKAKQRTPNCVLGVGDVLGEDSYLVTEFLPDQDGLVFERVREEVEWTSMYHRGGEVPRQVAVQGEVGEDGSFPVYRHPADESPPLKRFSPTVALIQEHVQNVINHPVNHVLIQRYRDGKDYISEHSDKTIDVVRGSSIVNVSLGAQRTMTLRMKKSSSIEEPPNEASSATKAPRKAQRIPLPHNSMFVMGPETNRRWLHGIRQDHRPVDTKSEKEQFQEGERISLTFRWIGTFLSGDGRIWGQGARGKRWEERRAVGGEMGEKERLIWAFGEENRRGDSFDWDEVYGQGFDVVHFSEEKSG